MESKKDTETEERWLDPIIRIFRDLTKFLLGALLMSGSMGLTIFLYPHFSGSPVPPHIAMYCEIIDWSAIGFFFLMFTLRDFLRETRLLIKDIVEDFYAFKTIFRKARLKHRIETEGHSDPAETKSTSPVQTQAANTHNITNAPGSPIVDPTVPNQLSQGGE